MQFAGETGIAHLFGQALQGRVQVAALQVKHGFADVLLPVPAITAQGAEGGGIKQAHQGLLLAGIVA
ncbi:hypothetical protein D3C71_1954720 [compost metagenome]